MSDAIKFVEMDEEEFLQEALFIVEKAQARTIPLRILGAMAVYAHSRDKPEFMSLFRSLPRFGEDKPNFTDLDLAGYRKQRKDILRLFEELSYKPDYALNTIFAAKRLLLHHPQGKYDVDVFLDKLEFSHEVVFGEKPGNGRLELSYPTITLADIALEKLQIHLINRKDVIDLILLFLTHDVEGQECEDAVDGSQVATVLSGDWGFWYDATANLEKVRLLTGTLTESAKLSEEQAGIITQRVNKLRKIIDDTPKTKNWEKRAKAGTSKPWYREIEEVVR
jgi:hypothetical protein